MSVDATTPDGVAAENLSVGDVVVVDRSVGSITAKAYATVVAIDGRGSRLVGPDYPSPAFGGALKGNIRRAVRSRLRTAVLRSVARPLRRFRRSDGGGRCVRWPS